MRCKALFALAPLILATAIVRGQPSPSMGNKDSLEWAAEDANLVVRGTVTDVTYPNRENTTVVVGFHVAETLKGSCGKDIQFAAVSDSSTAHAPDPLLASLVKSSTDCIVLLVNSSDPKNNIPSLSKYARLATRSGRLQGALMQLNGNDGVQAIGMDFKLIAKPAEILARTKDAIRVVGNEPHFYRFDRPPRSFIKQLPESWRRVFPPKLAVPIDARLEKLGHKWLATSDLEWMGTGVEALSPFPSKKNRGLLEKAIKRVEAMQAGSTTFFEDSRSEFLTRARHVLETWFWS